MRTQTDCKRDIYDCEHAIASNRKSAATTTNKKTAGIADATLPALERKLAALRAELPTLPAERQREVVINQPFTFNYATHFADGMDDLPIPEFLRRIT